MAGDGETATTGVADPAALAGLSISTAPAASRSCGRTTAESRHEPGPPLVSAMWAIQLPAAPSQRVIRAVRRAGSHESGPPGLALGGDGERDADGGGGIVTVGGWLDNPPVGLP